MKNKKEQVCYKPMEVKEILNISQAQVYKLFAGEAGEQFPSFKVAGNWRVRVKDFDTWLENKIQQGWVA